MSETDIIKNGFLYGSVTKRGVAVMKLSPVEIEVLRHDEITLLRVFKNGVEDTTLRLGHDVAKHLGTLLIESARQSGEVA